MEKLRIHKMEYRNRGMANRKLRGQQEYHVIFKFDIEEKADDFIKQVKEWYYSLEKVGKDEILKESVPEKRKAGRPPKKNLQG